MSPSAAIVDAQLLKQQQQANAANNTTTTTTTTPAAKARLLATIDNFPGLQALTARVRKDMQLLNYPARQWVRARAHPSTGERVVDVLVVGGGQCGLATTFGLMQEKVTNVLVLDENPAGQEGPWVTYARMVTLRTNKALTGPDLGVPSLTFQAFYEAKYGAPAWEALDKIPKEEWMAYLLWYREALQLPVRNSRRVELIEPEPCVGGFKVSVRATNTATSNDNGDTTAVCETIYARKVVLATGIQGGGEWHVPSLIRDALPASLYAHTSRDVDFAALRGKRVAILGGGASAFDNAQHALEAGVGEVVAYVRRAELPRVNPIRFMEFAGFLRHFSDLDDATKYVGIDHFMKFNQPPTNDTFCRAARFDNFTLRTGAPWERVVEEGGKIRIFTPNGRDEGLFDFAIVSTGLLTDARLRPELRAVADNIKTWGDVLERGEVVLPPGAARNTLIDSHPYLGPNFEFTPRDGGGNSGSDAVRGVFAYNYSALPSLGLSGSALSGMRAAMPKLISGITRQLFLDDKDAFVSGLLEYQTEEFLQRWPLEDSVRSALRAKLDGCCSGGGGGGVAGSVPPAAAGAAAVAAV